MKKNKLNAAGRDFMPAGGGGPREVECECFHNRYRFKHQSMEKSLKAWCQYDSDESNGHCDSNSCRCMITL
jgi:hypothetical protein